MKYFTNKLICIDIETTDLDQKIGEVIQIGAIKVDTDFNMKEHDTFNMYIKPITKHRNIQAMQCNNISEETLRSGDDLNTVLELFESYCGPDSMLCSWGITFDITFLQEQYVKINRPWPFKYRFFDLRSITMWEFAKQNIKCSGGLHSSLAILNIKHTGIKHDALDDIINSAKVLAELLKRHNISTQPKGW